MNDWWKAPVLQGEDNDYGQYDYMIEEIPENYMGWEFDREYKWACSDCHKESHLLFRAVQYFHTLDGYDSFDYSECWKCFLRNKIHCFKWKIQKNFKKQVETLKWTMELYDIGHKSLTDCYKLAKQIVR